MTASLQPFQTWEFYKAERMPAETSLDLMRLRWKAFGDITTAVRIAAHARDPPSNGDEAYCKPGNPPSLHPMSESSLTEPPISSITVTLDDLDTREEDWVLEHMRDDGSGDDVWENVDDDEGGDGGDGRKLVRCCNEDRPYAPAPLTIQGSTDKGYVTIRDYVVAVHALLQSHRDEIVQHMITTRGEPHSPGDVELWVNLFTSDRIRLDDGKPGAMPFLSLWPRWTSYIDRLLGGEFPSREESFRSMQPPQRVTEGVPQGHLRSQVMEAVPRGHLHPDRVPGLARMFYVDIADLILRQQGQRRNEESRR